MGRIIQLSKNVINQIAAGEVIERPFSVVKELVENSIDAGASKVSIEISNECRNIRVADNGSGIHPDDIMLAFSKHATSKINSGEDLYNVKTMGFRGEALASIISISKLTCITRTKDFEYGQKVECENSEVKSSKTGCAVGTIMEIRDLFYNIPVRLKFLKSSKTESAYITELIRAIAFAHPNVSIECRINGKISVKTTGQNNLLIAIDEVFPDVPSNLKEVLKTDMMSGLKISGYISTPDFTRASKKDYYMFVNSRLVKCPVFQKSIDTVYKNLTGNLRYPFIVLNLEIPTEDVDVNVHPTKKEVKYKNPNQIFNFIYAAINEALSNKIESENHNFETKTESHLDLNHKEENFYIEQKQQTSFSPLKAIYNPDFKSKHNDDTYLDTSEAIADNFYDVESTPNSSKNKFSLIKNIDETKNTSFAVPAQGSFIKNITEVQEDIIIGQYKNTYILIEKEDGLEIVDQHIAEERYIYEQLKKSKNIDCQLLFISDIIEISPSDREILQTNEQKLQKFGYEIDFMSENEVIFRKVPQLLSKIPPKEILSDILEHISGDIDNIEEQILITTSCKAAVKANTHLNLFQMQEIIKNWRTCEKPYTCPHGRPISHIIEHKDLAKFFQRTK